MDCVHIPELGYGEFSDRLHKKVQDKRIPISGSLEVTLRCNLGCQHCYVSHGHSGIPGQEELSFREIQRIIDEVVDAGCLWLLLTGGDPFMRRDFLDIYTYAKKKGLLVTVFTNGTLLTERVVDHLAEWRPFSIEITLYGYTEDTYERVTGVPGSHKRCYQGIERLLERGLPLKLKTMLMSLNHHELADMQAFAESLDLDFRFDPIINAGIVDSQRPIPLRLSPEEVVQIELDDPIRSTRWPEQFKQLREAKPISDKLYLCGAGKSSFHIDPFGKLCLCTSAREPGYDLRDGTFLQGWQDFLGQISNQEISEEYECGDCELRLLCAQCPAMAQTELGSPEKRVPYYCQIAHMRARAFNPGLIVSENSNIIQPENIGISNYV